MIVPNFKILGTVVPEKSFTKKSLHTHSHKEKAKTIYPLYTSVYREGRGGGVRVDVNEELKFL